MERARLQWWWFGEVSGHVGQQEPGDVSSVSSRLSDFAVTVEGARDSIGLRPWMKSLRECSVVLLSGQVGGGCQDAVHYK